VGPGPGRPDDPSYFVARATTDSVFVGSFYFTGRGVSDGSSSDKTLKRRNVFGQVFVVTMTNGPRTHHLTIGQRVVLVWWTYDAGCNTYFPNSALNIPGAETVFVTRDPLPRHQWVNAMPTYDVNQKFLFTHAIYSSHFQSRVRYSRSDTMAATPLTAAEYAQLYEMLPVSSLRRDEWLVAAQTFLDWAQRNPGIASRQPGAILVDLVRRNMD
jgi:hypothetical protein